MNVVRDGTDVFVTTGPRGGPNQTELVTITEYTKAVPVLVVFWSKLPRSKHEFIATLPDDLEAAKVWVDEWFKAHPAMAAKGDAIALVRSLPNTDINLTVYDKIIP